MTLRLGPYELYEVAGRGGGGEVWQALHTELGLPVAIKVLDWLAAANPAAVRAFRDEARAVASLDHPHIVRLYDHGEVPTEVGEATEGAVPAGCPYLVMEWASGGSASRARPYAWADLRDVLRAMLEALAHAHARGVLHRDIKPGNVLRCTPEDARPGWKLADFGIARWLVEGDAHAWRPAGTPPFMAPEQRRGGPQGPWTDLYALGCTAYRLASGRNPFSDRSERGDPPPLEARFPVPAGFEAWLRSLLAPEARGRFAFAADAAAALEALDGVGHGGRRRVSEPGRELPQPAIDAGLPLYRLRPVPLVDRDDEREVLWDTLQEVARGARPRAVVLRGPAGVGKSRLAHWLCERAHELGAAVPVRALHGPRQGPADGLVPMLTRHLGALGLTGEALARWVEEVPGSLDDPRDRAALVQWVGGAVEERAGRQERFALIARVLGQLGGGRPVIAWLDDVQWGEEALCFVRHVLGAVNEGTPILFLLTVREEALPDRPTEEAALTSLLQLGRERAFSLTVCPMGLEHHRALVQSLLVLDGNLADEISRRTRGNPLFAVQLVSDWVERGLLRRGDDGLVLAPGARVDLPDELAAVWEARIERLLERRPASDGLALEIAAVLGQEVDAGEWSRACAGAGLPDPGVLGELLLDQRLASQDPGGAPRAWSFVHGMLREAVEKRAREGGRLAAHHAACAAAIDEHAPFGAERRGEHLLEAGQSDEAVRPLLRGLRERRARGDLTAGVRLARLALGALHEVSAPPTDVRWGEVRASGALAFRSRTGGEGEAWARRALSDALRYGWDAVAMDARKALAVSEGYRGAYRAMLEHCEAWEARASAVEDGPRRIAARDCRARALAGLGRFAESERLLRQVLEEAAQLGLLGTAQEVWINLAFVGVALGRYDEARGDAERYIDVKRRRGNRHNEAHGWNVLGDIERQAGRLAGAREAYLHALELYRQVGSRGVSYAEMNVAQTDALLGRLEEASARLRRVGRVWSEPLVPLGLAIVRAVEAYLAACSGDWKAAHDRASDVLRLAAQADGAVELDLAFWAERTVEVALQAGGAEVARVLAPFAVAQWRGLGRSVDAERAEALRRRVG